jgi:hypothetical protein
MEHLSHPDQKSPLQRVEHPPTYTLDYILTHVNAPKRFDLLSIDVEGSEHRVLYEFDVERYKPRIVIIEDWNKSGSFNKFFPDYTSVRSGEQGVGGTNIIYCREQEDAEVVASRWHP